MFRVEASVIAALRHRLLAVTAALIAKAVELACPQAILVLHEFRSAYTPRQIAADQLGDADDFVASLSHQRLHLKQPGQLVGPLTSRIVLFVGRALVER